MDPILNNNLDSYYNSWLLVYIIGRMFEFQPKWLYIHKKLVKYRSGNDSFLAKLGVYNRQLITYVNFPKIIQSIFGYRTKAYKNVIHTLVVDRMARSLAVIKADGGSVAIQFKIFLMYLKSFWYFPLFWYKVFPFFFIPNQCLCTCITTFHYQVYPPQHPQQRLPTNIITVIAKLLFIPTVETGFD